MDAYAPGIERMMKRLFDSLREHDRRRYAAIEATKLGYGGVEYIARVLECDPKTIGQGQAELEGGDDLDTGRVRKKLGRQSLIDEGILKRFEVRHWVTAEAATERPHGLTLLQRAPESTPRLQVGRNQFRRVNRAQPSRGRRHQAHGAPHHRPRARHLPTAAPPLVVAVRAEELLQLVVGPRQAADVVAPEQPRPVALRHLAEVIRRLGQRAQRLAVPGQRGGQSAVASSHRRRTQPLLVGQDRGQAPDPAEGRPYLRPRRLGRFQTLAQNRPQPRQFPREPLFDPTRSKLSATFVSRSCSLSPDGTSGGRPSSVNAERTAAQ